MYWPTINTATANRKATVVISRAMSNSSNIYGTSGAQANRRCLCSASCLGIVLGSGRCSGGRRQFRSARCARALIARARRRYGCLAARGCALVTRLAPNLSLANGLNADYLSHDRRVVDAYRQDPLVHNRICARLGAFVASAGEQVLRQAPQWEVPTLLLYAGEDRW